MRMNKENKCPGCLDNRLKSWSELSADEQEVVRRLPAAREYSLNERQRHHLWCTRCWYETAGQESRA